MLGKSKRTLLVADRTKFRLELYTRPLLSSEYKLKSVYRIAVGAEGYATPKGVYGIRVKAKCPEWLIPNSDWATDAGLTPGRVIPGCDPANPLKERWLGVTDPAEGVGIHGTGDLGSLGSRASHGCIRMDPADVIKLYKQVPKETPIVII